LFCLIENWEGDREVNSQPGINIENIEELYVLDLI